MLITPLRNRKVFSILIITEQQDTITSSTAISCASVNTTGDITIGGLLNNKNRVVRYYRAGNENLGNQTTYQVVAAAVGMANSAIITTSGTNTWTIEKTGRYRIFSRVVVDNGSYTDRINWRLRLFVNGRNTDEMGQSFAYTRHRDWVDYGALSHQTILDLTANNTFYYLVDINRGGADGFSSSMSGSIVSQTTCLEVEFLGS